jgi:hypothetical protein
MPSNDYLPWHLFNLEICRSYVLSYGGDDGGFNGGGRAPQQRPFLHPSFSAACSVSEVDRKRMHCVPTVEFKQLVKQWSTFQLVGGSGEKPDLRPSKFTKLNLISSLFFAVSSLKFHCDAPSDGWRTPATAQQWLATQLFVIRWILT